MHNETIKPDSIRQFIKRNYVMLFIGLLILLSSAAAANYVLPSRNEITYQDPNDAANYLTINQVEHSFIIHQASGEMLSGTYTETSESYNLKYDQGFGQTCLKQGNGIVTPKGNTWVRK